MNFSSLQTAEEKLAAAEIAFDIDYNNIWEYLYSAINNSGRSMFGELSSPKYREHEKAQATTIAEMRKAHLGYFELLIKHMDFSVDRWKKMIDLSDEVPENLNKNIFLFLVFCFLLFIIICKIFSVNDKKYRFMLHFPVFLYN